MPPKIVPSSSKPSLKQLQTKLKSLQNSFNIIVKFKQEFKDDTTANEITVRLERFDELWERIVECSSDVECHEDYVAEEGDPFTTERLGLEQSYFEVKSFLLDKIKETQDVTTLDQTARTSDSSFHAVHDHVRLPQIKLRTFDGNTDEWFSFRDLYTSLIHWKQELPEVEKFHYLKGCLEGEARSLIEPIKITTGTAKLPGICC